MTILSEICSRLLSAMAGLAQAGRMRSKETVLVTAAAGGTGQFAVQLAKLAGNTVVATCGSDDKAQLLTGLGCDRVINYNKEQVKVLLVCTSMHVMCTHTAMPCYLHHSCLAGQFRCGSWWLVEDLQTHTIATYDLGFH